MAFPAAPGGFFMQWLCLGSGSEGLTGGKVVATGVSPGTPAAPCPGGIHHWMVSSTTGGHNLPAIAGEALPNLHNTTTLFFHVSHDSLVWVSPVPGECLWLMVVLDGQRELLPPAPPEAPPADGDPRPPPGPLFTKGLVRGWKLQLVTVKTI